MQLRATIAGERIAPVVDTEATGLAPTKDRIIQIAVQRLIFDGERRIVEIERAR